MTERKPTGIGFESWVERQIREATEAGKLDDLPGRGKPIPGLNQPYDELWWIRRKMASEGLANDALLPTPLKLRREIEELPETIRTLRTEKAVREAIANVNKRIVEHLRTPSGPRVPVRPVDPEPLVEQWNSATGRANTATGTGDTATGRGDTAEGGGRKPTPAAAAEPGRRPRRGLFRRR
ncbi:MAG TPA: DUF1992 domain-containing protein [Amycolatopsis sp.]|nr:DUF1992 domain-containing protein [Amycolatopsis sp.]